jgi:Na+-driven multidrug efflux pump
MGAAGFWLAGVTSLVVAAVILFAYFMHVSRRHEAGTI